MEENKFKVLCAVQILRVDRPNITGDEIAFELNNQGLRRSRGKLWNKGTVNHLIANAEKEPKKETTVINPKKVVQEIPRQPEQGSEANPYAKYLIPSVEPKPEKTLIEKDFSSDVDLCAGIVRKMDIEWKKCLVWKEHITATIKGTEHDRQEFINAITNKIYWDEDCQDLDFEKSWVYNQILGFATYEEMKAVIIPKKLKCIEVKGCTTPVIINDRKERDKIRCDHHQRVFFYHQYIASAPWKEISNRVMERDGYTCRTCDSPNDLRVHHKTYARLGKELDTDLITLCKTCDKVIEPIRKEVAKLKRNGDLPDSESKKKPSI